MSVNATPLLRFDDDEDDDSEEVAEDLLLMDHHHHHRPPPPNANGHSRRMCLSRQGDDPQQPYQQVYRLILDGTAAEEQGKETLDILAGHPNHHHHSYDDYCGILTTSNTNNDDNHTIRFFPPLGAVANLCSATLGAGVLAIPYAMYQAGILAGGLMMIGAGLATYSSIDILSRCTSYYHHHHHHPDHQPPNWSTYESLVEGVLKLPYYRTMVELSLLLFCGGCAVAYLIAVGDILELVGFVGHGRRAWSMMILWVVVMMPLSMLRHMNSIAGASAIGVSAIGTLVFATAIHVLITPHPTLTTYSTTTTTTTTTNPLGWAKFLFPAHGWISILTACPVVLFAFSCQANVCAIYDELPMPNNRTTSPPTSTNTNTTTTTTTTTTHSTPSVNRRIQQEQQQMKLMMMDRVAISSVAICAILYTSISLFVVADFGSAVLPNLLLNYHHHPIINGQEQQDKPDSIMQVATAAMAVAVILAYPLNIFPARVTLIGLLEKRKLPYDNGNRDNDAAADQDDDDTVRGGTRGALRINVPNNNLTQALLQDQMEQEQMESAAAPATIHAINETTNGSVVNHSINGVGEPVVVQSTSETLVPAASTTNPEDTTESPIIIRFDLQQHVVITLFLTGTSLALALLIPDIKVMFGLVGGTASSMIGFCIPGLLGLQLAHDVHQDTGHTQWSTWIISWSLLIGGAVVGAITTVATIYDLVRHY